MFCFLQPLGYLEICCHETCETYDFGPQYVPVRTKSFESVEILLRNDAGEPVPFERGKVVVTLHFRQLTQF